MIHTSNLLQCYPHKKRVAQLHLNCFSNTVKKGRSFDVIDFSIYPISKRFKLEYFIVDYNWEMVHLLVDNVKLTWEL